MNSMNPPVTTPLDATTQLSPLKRAFLALEDTQARLAAAQRAGREPIAVIGMSCRVPGAANPAEFWELLRDGRDAMGQVPPDRFDIDAYFDPDPAKPGKIAAREAGFIDEVDRFDPGFFGIAPREANGMDPQQRLLLEVSWEALEHAGQAPDRLAMSATGVYAGLCSTDYAYLQLHTGDRSLLDSHFTSGVAHSVAAGRISYLLGLQGPNVTVDTACSSSLVAVHLACQALRSGECRMALAGGVNLMLSADLFVAFSHSRMLAPDGRCKTFDAAADGFARGEGAGVVVLKRLVDAQADGDRILAVLRGSAINQDGPSSGLTAPNGPAQEAVIRMALDRAGVAPADVGYVEAHGTGTQLGDPLEARALGNVFGPGRDAARPLRLASVKTNLGHLEAAAGVTGLIKVVLALQNRALPAHLHFKNPSPHIMWADLPIEVPTTLTPWDPIGGRRIAGVSAFGFSGTNAHVIVEEAPRSAVPASPSGEVIHLYRLSARDESALQALAARHAIALDGRRDASLASLSFTANVGRASFAHRAVVAASNVDDLRTRLHALARGEQADGLRAARMTRRDPPRIAFLFTGQGSQYAGMARGLYDSEPVFRAALDRCAEGLDGRLDRPLLEILYAADSDPSLLDQTEYTQPALFAVEYGLAQLWQSWGVKPAIVMGHSVGEVVAACVAGVMNLDDALGLIAERGRLMGSLPAGGAMAAVYAPAAEVESLMAPYAASVAIAAFNTAEQCVISGAAAQVDLLCTTLAQRGVRCQRLPVSHAFHSPLVEPVLDAFERVSEGIKWSAPGIRLISNLTGAVATPSMLGNANYWRRHVRQPVRFADAARSLALLRPDICIEIGPSPALLSFVQATIGAAPTALVPSLRKGRPDRAQILDALATCHLEGVEIDWRAVYAGQSCEIVDLPTYPFQRERCWFNARTQNPVVAARGRPTGKSLLGTRLRSAGAETVYESRVSAEQPAFVAQHKVQGQVVMPATAYLEGLLAAAQDLFGAGPRAIEDVTLQEAMLLGDEQRTVQLVLAPAADGAVTARLCSMADTAAADVLWTCHVSAALPSAAPSRTASIEYSLADARRLCAEQVDTATFYAGFAQRGLAFGPAFESITQLWRGDYQALGEVRLREELSSESGEYHMHPVLLDGCLQLMGAALMTATDDELYLPFAIGRYTLHRDGGQSCWAHVRADAGQQGETRRADLRVFDAHGELLAELIDIRVKRVARDALARIGGRSIDDSLYETVWESSPLKDVRSEHAEAGDVSIVAMAHAANASMDRLREAARLEAFDVGLPSLEALCVEYILNAFVKLGWAPAAGSRVAESALADQLQVIPRYRRLLGRYLAILADAGWIAREGDQWRVQRSFEATRPDLTFERLAAAHPPIAAELELTGRTGSALAEALRGECDPLQLLFPGGSTATAERVYRDSPPSRVFNGIVGEAVAAAARGFEYPKRPMRILEVGAGTGGTTAHTLPLLEKANVEYTFTDVGKTFVTRAHERFGKHPFMRFDVLDLERDPQDQGFGGRTFDLVVASNVIHATCDLRATLGRVRSLLAPNGVLVLLEATAPQAWFDLTVGLTTGWWSFQDLDLRPDYATLSTAAWVRLLGQCGFADATAVAGDPQQQGTVGLNVLLLACAAGQKPAATSAGDWLVLADATGVAEGLANRLCARGDRCQFIHSGEVFEAEKLRVLERPLLGVIDARALDFPHIDALKSSDFGNVVTDGAVRAMRTAQMLVGLMPAPQLWMLTRGAQAIIGSEGQLAVAGAALWGLGKALRLEHPELRTVCIDLDPAIGPDEQNSLVAELNAHEGEVALRGNMRYVARLAHLPSSGGIGRRAALPTPWRLASAVQGSLASVQPVPCERRAPATGEIEIAVEAVALNFKDVLNVLGLYPGNAGPLGGECAGVVSAVGAGVEHLRIGDPVMALAGGSFASHVIAQADFVQVRSPGVGAEEGASFSIAYLTAAFCLEHLGKLRAGQRVLIHAAAGGVGMAALCLARRAGAEIFATAGSPWKRDMLRSMGATHVFDSRSADFADDVMASTGGQGVDVVLNSLGGDLIEPSFAVLASGGCFVEIGKSGIKSPEWVEALGRDICYHIVDWGETARSDPALIAGLYTRLAEEMRIGKLAALPRHVFALDHAAHAFQFMARARHAGKIIVRVAGAPPWTPRRDASYLVTGGLSGLGLQVARWLAEGGAGRLVLIGRRGVTPESASMLDALRSLGAEIVTEAIDVTDEAALSALLKRQRAEGPPLRGVWHCAGVLDDAALTQQNDGRYARVFGPKVRGTALLDALTRGDPLDCFVLFSSVAAVLGSQGQSNHSAANAFLDSMAHHRASRGLPALSINWGSWSEVGAAANRRTIGRSAAQGLAAVTPEQGLSAMKTLLDRDVVQAAVIPIDWARYLAQLAPTGVPTFLTNVAEGARASSSTAAAVPRATAASDLRERLAEVPEARRRTLVANFVRERALDALGIDRSKSVDPRTPLGDLGLDSLLAVELRNTLSTAIGQPLSVTLLFDYPTLDALTDYLLEVLEPEKSRDVAPAASVDPGTSLVGSIEGLSDAEVDRMIEMRAQRKS
jgi:acyl transferase domain-containing protein/NADPH:quinone reductase-like Zn-dependent oxidoreductase/NAD(P)-dependent dehydrogenase (short-subunit alcohol dehydrogenase family)/SAM-dependent methyltransferase/acyl carrier protein